jgi:hypothetical protein
MTIERAVLLAFGAGQLLLGLFIIVAPGAFADSLGAFGVRNDHLARDSATIYLALGFGLLVAAERPDWRVPVLALATVQYALHAVNHLVDIGDSDPGWIGPADVVLLAGGVVLLGWLWHAVSSRSAS